MSGFLCSVKLLGRNNGRKLKRNERFTQSTPALIPSPLPSPQIIGSPMEAFPAPTPRSMEEPHKRFFPDEYVPKSASSASLNRARSTPGPTPTPACSHQQPARAQTPVQEGRSHSRTRHVSESQASDVAEELATRCERRSPRTQSTVAVRCLRMPEEEEPPLPPLPGESTKLPRDATRSSRTPTSSGYERSLPPTPRQSASTFKQPRGTPLKQSIMCARSVYSTYEFEADAPTIVVTEAPEEPRATPRKKTSSKGRDTITDHREAVDGKQQKLAQGVKLWNDRLFDDATTTRTVSIFTEVSSFSASTYADNDVLDSHRSVYAEPPVPLHVKVPRQDRERAHKDYEPSSKASSSSRASSSGRSSKASTSSSIPEMPPIPPNSKTYPVRPRSRTTAHASARTTARSRSRTPARASTAPTFVSTAPTTASVYSQASMARSEVPPVPPLPPVPPPKTKHSRSRPPRSVEGTTVVESVYSQGTATSDDTVRAFNASQWEDSPPSQSHLSVAVNSDLDSVVVAPWSSVLNAPSTTRGSGVDSYYFGNTSALMSEIGKLDLMRDSYGVGGSRPRSKSQGHTSRHRSGRTKEAEGNY
ncbi:uncharacterized protein SCHCODRAFT_02623747 [Schizophyllum commune H4-8]|uniref:Uncharacterized protein n=1 Tax=Schizophyllum commune (strain H4-8 / FGSC 9210) TaxID=578458 RepID=D8PKD1_SCHCM|nr:uncharacterized protein SCHCODRAFT_02623747 [Schizophyllum commune H4-8]KAI5894108.1 hypothetical protein SCHCODRAFT_02623747 [Schizophyllum commune H4-8]